MRLLSFGPLSIHLIFPFLIPFSRLLNNKSKKLFNLPYYSKLPFVSTMLMFSGEMIGGGLLYFLGFNRGKGESGHFKNIKSLRKKIITKIPSRASLFSFRRIAVLFLYSLFDFIGSTAFNSIGTPEFNYLMRSLQLFIYALLAVKILRYKVYSHKYLSIALIIIGVVIANIKIDFEGFKWYWIPLAFLGNSLYSINDTGAKWLMLNRHFNPMLMLFLEGIFGIIICILVLSGLTVYCLYDKLNDYCENIDYFYHLTAPDAYYIMTYVS